MDAGALGVYMCLFVGLYFEVFLLISFLEKRPAKRTGDAPARYPSVAVIVPCYNEERTIAGTLNSLLALQYPKNRLSIVVVDDGSRDNTGSIAARFAKAHKQIRYFKKENGGKYTALNFGIEHSDAEIVGCLDADSFVAPDALLEAAKRFASDPEVMAITPVMKVYKPRRLLELMQAVEYTFGVFYKKMFDNLSAINVLPGPFSLYRRSIFATIGPFRHAHNTEDMEIAFRMHAHGLKIANIHTAVVYTTVPKTVRSLVKQRTRWSQGFLQNARDYGHMFFNRKYGHFGSLVLPFMLFGFIAGLYTAGYAVYNAVSFIAVRTLDYSATGVPFTLPHYRFDWFYIDTGVMGLLVVAVLGMTLLAIILGQRIAETRLTLASFVSYFTLFGFIAPLWLVQAAWGALLARESAWR